jgi:hypothetical protein
VPPAPAGAPPAPPLRAARVVAAGALAPQPLPPQPQPPPEAAPGVAVDMPLRQKYAPTRALVRAAPLPAPDPALSPAAAAWFAALGIPHATLAAAGAGMVRVAPPRPGAEPVDAVALPHRDAAGRVLDMRYWALDGRGGLTESWLAHGGGPFYAVDPATALAGGGEAVFVGDELEALALHAAGCPVALAVQQQLPSWRAGSPAYDDARARAQPLREHIEALRKAQEAAAAGVDAGGAAALLMASLGLASDKGAPAGGAPSPPASPPRRPGRKARRGASAAAAAQGLGLLLPNADGAVLAFAATRQGQQLAAELAGLLGAARCRAVSWPASWDEHPEDDGRDEGARRAARIEQLGDTGYREGVLDVLAADGGWFESGGARRGE